MKTVVYSRVERCPYCVKAKALLEAHGVSYDEIVVGQDIDKAAFQARFLKRFNRLVEAVPQVIIGATLIGGYDELKAHFDAHPSDHTETITIADLEGLSL
ncbi:glutaredoxin domain-containing protein [Marinobacterium sp. BA1]|uniref:glutaredoxin domain-containing protein n=1 Tax=Marinobacterium sp. BA1 TaxID=3138931 RepID=UPI0032E6CC00